jgi:hypothetical protein
VASPLQPRVVGPLYGTRCMAPQPFAAGGSRSYPYPLAVIDDRAVLKYFTPTSLYLTKRGLREIKWLLERCTNGWEQAPTIGGGETPLL